MFLEKCAVDPGFDALDYRFTNSASNDSPFVREKSLWCAVLLQAFVDAGLIALPTSRGGKTVTDDYDSRAAVRFLRRDKRDFPLVCELAGVNPSVVRMGAERIEFKEACA